MRRLVFTFAVVMNLLLIDQVSKAAALAYFRDHPPLTVIPNFFDLALVKNRGCAWGMFQGQVWPLAAFAIVGMVFLAWKRKVVFPKGTLGTIAEVLLWAGILGNLVDRICLGFVVDMLDFHWYQHHFPCFNFADSLITIAAGLLIMHSLFIDKQCAKAEKGG